MGSDLKIRLLSMLPSHLMVKAADGYGGCSSKVAALSLLIYCSLLLPVIVFFVVVVFCQFAPCCVMRSLGHRFCCCFTDFLEGQKVRVGGRNIKIKLNLSIFPETISK